MWVYSADRKGQFRSILTVLSTLHLLNWWNLCKFTLKIFTLTHSLTLGKEAGNVHFMYTLSSLLHYPLFTQRMRHFQCLWLVWSNFYLKCWGTVSSKASRVEEKGEFTPEGSMEQKCPRGKTSTWITIFCCIVTFQNVTIGCCRLLLFISVGSRWIISNFLELSYLRKTGQRELLRELCSKSLCWIELTLVNETRWANKMCTHKVCRFLPPMVLADCDPEQVQRQN